MHNFCGVLSVKIFSGSYKNLPVQQEHQMEHLIWQTVQHLME